MQLNTEKMIARAEDGVGSGSRLHGSKELSREQVRLGRVVVPVILGRKHQHGKGLNQNASNERKQQWRHEGILESDRSHVQCWIRRNGQSRSIMRSPRTALHIERRIR